MINVNKFVNATMVGLLAIATNSVVAQDSVTTTRTSGYGAAPTAPAKAPAGAPTAAPTAPAAATATTTTTTTVPATATTDAAQNMEKCFGISKSGKNDCQTATHSCAGTASQDRQADAFLIVPKGLCDKISGGSTSMQTSQLNKQSKADKRA